MLFAGQNEFYVYRVKGDGSELQKVITTPLLPLAVSPDGQWSTDPTAWGALFLIRLAGVPAATLRFVRTAWGPEPPAFYFGWAPNSEFAYWTFTNATYTIQLRWGQLLPGIPAGGIQSKDGVGALPGARLISEQDRISSRTESVDLRICEGFDAAQHLPRSCAVKRRP